MLNPVRVPIASPGISRAIKLQPFEIGEFDRSGLFLIAGTYQTLFQMNHRMNLKPYSLRVGIPKGSSLIATGAIGVNHIKNPGTRTGFNIIPPKMIYLTALL
jgi:hypothetical protein